LFSIIFAGKVAHTSLVLVVKISYQSKKLLLIEKHSFLEREVTIKKKKKRKYKSIRFPGPVEPGRQAKG